MTPKKKTPSILIRKTEGNLTGREVNTTREAESGVIYIKGGQQAPEEERDKQQILRVSREREALLLS